MKPKETAPPGGGKLLLPEGPPPSSAEDTEVVYHAARFGSSVESEKGKEAGANGGS